MSWINRSRANVEDRFSFEGYAQRYRLNPEDNRASIVAKIKEGLLYEMRRPPF